VRTHLGRRSDQVFQLSLTEIAFAIAFILLLLLGWLVVTEQEARRAAEEALAHVQSVERATKTMNDAKADLAQTLRQAGATNPDEAIKRLVDAGDARAERDRLKQEIADLDAKLTALTELQRRLQQAAAASAPRDVTTEEVTTAIAIADQVRRAFAEAPAASGTGVPTGAGGSRAPGAGRKAPGIGGGYGEREDDHAGDRELAMLRDAITVNRAFRDQLQAQLGRKIQPGEEAAVVHDVVTAAAQQAANPTGATAMDNLRHQDADLRGQVAFLKNRLDARGGRDYPPCWADADGRVEFLLAIELRNDDVIAKPAWPSSRDAEARALPGMNDLIARPVAYTAWPQRVQGIVEAARKRDPECRYYVQLKSDITEAVKSDRARWMVENDFYKVEVRR
jgi:hypothetical protein